MEYILINENDFQKARKKIRKNKKKKIIFWGKDDELNRKILEKEKIDILLINLAGRMDKQKQRDSGLNHVLSKLAKKGGVSIGINLDEILGSDSYEKMRILARVRQNIKLCKKNKLKMVFVSSKKKDKYDLRSLGIILGMSTKMASDLELIECKQNSFNL